MISNGQVIEIVRGLLEKTTANQVNWHVGEIYDDPSDVYLESNSFFVQLPESRVTVTFEAQYGVPDQIVIEFKNKENLSVKRLRVDWNSPDWELARDLYHAIGRALLGWDKVLDEIEDAVRGEEQIGLPEGEI